MDLAHAWRRYVAAPLYIRMAAPFLAGAAVVPAMPPHAFWIMLWPGLSIFFILLHHTRTKKEAFLYGWMFGFGYFVFGLSWIANALTVEGSTYSWVIPLAIAGLPALLAVFTGLAALLCRWIGSPSRLSGFLGFAGFFSLFEWLRGHVFTGFPWNLFGYAWDSTPAMAQSVSLFGVYGLTALTILWASFPGFLVISRHTRRFTLILGAAVYLPMLVLFAWGEARLSDHPTRYNDTIVLRIVQPSIPQSLKWDQGKAIENFQKIASASSVDGFSAPSDKTVLMIWPETAVTQDIIQHPIAQNVLKREFSRYPKNFYLATGLLRWEKGPEKMLFYNSIATYDRHLNRLSTYDKSHLVPFGEYIPFSKWLPANPMVPTDGLEAGGGPSTLAIPLGPGKAFVASPTVCYEVIFPGAIVARGGGRPGLLLNVTNDGWYGDSAGPRQHLSIARYRAIEEGLPMARAANSGISAIIDPYGRILWSLPLFQVGASDMSLPLPAQKATIYGRCGDGPFAVLVLFLCAAAIVLGDRRKITE